MLLQTESICSFIYVYIVALHLHGLDIVFFIKNIQIVTTPHS